MKKDKDGNIIINDEVDFAAYLATRKNKKLYDIKEGKVVVDHLAAANVLAKFIELCPMDRWIKRVMLMRVGNPLQNKREMSHMQIALNIGATVDEVIEIEKCGKQIVGEFLSKCSQRETVEKFNSLEGNRKEINNIKNTLANPVNPAAEKE